MRGSEGDRKTARARQAGYWSGSPLADRRDDGRCGINRNNYGLGGCLGLGGWRRGGWGEGRRGEEGRKGKEKGQ